MVEYTHFEIGASALCDVTNGRLPKVGVFALTSQETEVQDGLFFISEGLTNMRETDITARKLK